MRHIYITAGHRGSGTGAKGIIDEGAETISLRDTVAKELAQRGCTVFRDANKDSLTAVISRINSVMDASDIVVDIHFNAFDGRANGTEVLISNTPTDMEQELAENLLHATTATLGTKNRGVRREGAGQHSRLAMLSDVKCNSVLVEVCFCDNGKDCEKYYSNVDGLVAAWADVLERQSKY